MGVGDQGAGRLGKTPPVLRIAEVARPDRRGQTGVMRVSALFVIVAALTGGCTPYIPVRDEFGVSALTPAGEVPTEFAAFNAYDANVGPMLARQICATSYVKLEDKSVGAVPGTLVQSRGRCETHRPIIGTGDGLGWMR